MKGLDETLRVSPLADSTQSFNTGHEICDCWFLASRGVFWELKACNFNSAHLHLPELMSDICTFVIWFLLFDGTVCVDKKVFSSLI